MMSSSTSIATWTLQLLLSCGVHTPSRAMRYVLIRTFICFCLTRGVPLSLCSTMDAEEAGRADLQQLINRHAHLLQQQSQLQLNSAVTGTVICTQSSVLSVFSFRYALRHVLCVCVPLCVCVCRWQHPLTRQQCIPLGWCSTERQRQW